MPKSLRELSQKFQLSKLHSQYLATPNKALKPDGWITNQLGNLFVFSHPSLPHQIISSEDGGIYAIILGHYISPTWEICGDLSELKDIRTIEEFEEQLEGIGGNFTVFVSTARTQRVYTDPCASSPVVYAGAVRSVASSPSLIPYNSATGDRKEIIQKMSIPESNLNYLLGETAREGVFRLLPNHTLDLMTFKSIRYWPRNALTKHKDVEAATDEIAEMIEKTIEAVGNFVPIQMSLTAGMDSRMLLACARKIAPDITFFTHRLPDRTGRLDSYMSRHLARDFRLNHRIIGTATSSVREREEWIFRTGYSVGERRGSNAVPMIKKLDPNKAYLPGDVAELGRGHHWNYLKGTKEAMGRSAITEGLLVDITRAPHEDVFVQRARDWINAIPSDDPYQILDYFYLEQRLGCWAGAQQPAYAGYTAFELWPLNHRRAVKLMLSLPHEYKKAKRLNFDIIRKTWPELLKYPINEGDWLFKAIELPYLLKSVPRRLGSKIVKGIRRAL